jgi:HptB-dependent secretion and biofilm anti anti-sigma factor
MEYTKIVDGNKCSIAVEGKFTFSDHLAFKKIFEIFTNSNIKELEIDIHNITFVDSAALGLLLLLKDNCTSHGVALTLLRPQGQVQKMLKISRFYELFKIID